VVIVREDTPGEKRLAAYFTASGEAPPVEELRNHLKEHLPDYMVPSALVLLDALPLTPNGKLDRNALPIPGGRPSNEYVAPVTEAEKRLIEIWKDVLGIDSVGVTDNFFAIGGHSLVAVKMLRRIHGAMGAEITLRDIFRFPTIAELSAAMATGLQSLQPQENPCLIRHGSLKPIFFVHAITGEADVYVGLANLLTVDAPAYGLHILDRKPRLFCQMSMRDLALHHVRAMQKVQRQGPYRLAGYSAGGLLAYAIACELRQGGEQVEFVGLIDTNDVSDTPVSDDISVAESVRLSIMQYNPGLEERVYQEMTRMEADDTAQAFFSRSQEAGYIPEKITFSDIVDRAEYLSILLSMARSYTPPPLDAAVHLFVCADTMKKLRWKEEITKTWTRHEIGGNHLTLIHPPFLAGLAGIMSSELTSMT
jgi:thioesterase domain-containing protein/acyl carrier protein